MTIRREVHYKSYLLPSFAERPGHVDAMFRAAVAAGAADLAVIDGDRRIDYGALDATVDRIAGNLARHGVGAGDRVAIVLGNKAEFIAASSPARGSAPSRSRSTFASAGRKMPMCWTIPARSR